MQCTVKLCSMGSNVLTCSQSLHCFASFLSVRHVPPALCVVMVVHSLQQSYSMMLDAADTVCSCQAAQRTPVKSEPNP